MKRFRAYADTSVYGGCFDEEFAKESIAFFDAVRRGRFKLVISPTVLTELQRASERVRKLLGDLPVDTVEMIDRADEIRSLREGYLEAGILGPEHQADAEHIASASVAEVDFVVSWNFKHIVQFEKIAG